MSDYKQCGPTVEIHAKALVCAVCRNATSLQPAGVTEWVCVNCARLGLVWAAKRAVSEVKVAPWWRRWLP